MTVRIGHASKNEVGRTTGGAAGDQTGKEVCTRNWYNGSWVYAARAKDPAVAERIAAACEAGCANEYIGYDQSARNTVLEEARNVNYALDKIQRISSADCSSFVTVCVQAAGVNLWNGGNAPTTGNLKSRLKATGAFDILTEERYRISPNYLRRGDILCKPGSHTVVVLDNGSNATADKSAPKSDIVSTYCSVQLPLLQKGSKGAAVKSLQTLLIGFGYSCGRWGADGDFGTGTESALKTFQKASADTGGKPLDADGKAGPKTWTALIGVR